MKVRIALRLLFILAVVFVLLHPNTAVASDPACPWTNDPVYTGCPENMGWPASQGPCAGACAGWGGSTSLCKACCCPLMEERLEQRSRPPARL
jgi:hypothetical protein